MIKREESRHDFAFMAGVVIGAVAGALATLALAPRAGTETRDRWRSRVQEMPVEDVRARASHLRDAAAQKTEHLREVAASKSPGDVVQTARSKVTDLVDRSPIPVKIGDDDGEIADQASDAVSDAQDSASDVAEDADQLIDETTSRAEDAADDAEDIADDAVDGDDEKKPGA